MNEKIQEILGVELSESLGALIVDTIEAKVAEIAEAQKKALTESFEAEKLALTESFEAEKLALTESFEAEKLALNESYDEALAEFTAQETDRILEAVGNEVDSVLDATIAKFVTENKETLDKSVISENILTAYQSFMKLVDAELNPSINESIENDTGIELSALPAMYLALQEAHNQALREKIDAILTEGFTILEKDSYAAAVLEVPFLNEAQYQEDAKTICGALKANIEIKDKIQKQINESVATETLADRIRKFI